MGNFKEQCVSNAELLHHALVVTAQEGARSSYVAKPIVPTLVSFYFLIILLQLTVAEFLIT